MSIRHRIKNHLANYRSVVIWGAGGLGRTALRYWLPLEKVAMVVDSNPAAAGRSLGGFFVRAPDGIDFTSIDSVVICTSAYLKVIPDLLARGFKGPVFYVYDLFLPCGEEPLTELQALAIDLAAAKNDNWLLFLLMKPQILVNFTFRVGNWSSLGGWRLPLYWLMFVLHQLTCLLTSIQLPLGTSIGPGLVFAHYGTIVFTRRARIGAFFTIYHGCTVGTNDSGEGPVIGSFVSQYAGSHVLGRCQIGDRSRIGANAVVLDYSCNAESTLVGIPARVIDRQQKQKG